jgi:hypothetical protein
MKRTFLLGVMFTAGVIVGVTAVVLLRPRREFPTVQMALKLNDPDITAFIANRIKTLQWTGPDGVKKYYRFSGKTNPNQRLVLKLDEPLVIPDDHGRTELALVEVRDGKARIAYMSHFGHSFGKNLMTVDCGIVHPDVQEDVSSVPAKKNVNVSSPGDMSRQTVR